MVLCSGVVIGVVACFRAFYRGVLVIKMQSVAPVAQLDRASVFGTEGWGFESLRAYFNSAYDKAHPTMADEETRPYHVDQQASSYRVLDAKDDVVCACSDQHSAEHYAVLFNQAHERGYKSGYRAGKLAGSR